MIRLGNSLGLVGGALAVATFSLGAFLAAGEPSLGASPRPVVRSLARDRPEVLSEASAHAELTPVTLEELIEQATFTSPNLREALALVRVERAKAVQAGLYPNPTLAIGSPQLAGNLSQYMTYLEQDLVTHGKLSLDRAAALRAADEARANYQRIRFELLTSVRQAFFQVATAERRVHVLEELADLARKSSQAALRLEEVGEGSRTDALLLEIEEQRAEVAAANGAARLAAAWRQLAAAVGEPALSPRSPRVDLTTPLPEFDFDVVRETVLLENAAVGAAQFQVSEARLKLARARVEPYPNLNIQAGYQYDVNPPLHDQGYVQASLTLPLWNRNQGNIRAARAAVGSAVAKVERVRNELASRVAASVGAYLAARQQVERYEQRILPRATEALQITQQAFEQGQFDFLRVLAAQRTAGEARLGYVNSQEERWLAAAELAGLLQLEQFP